MLGHSARSRPQLFIVSGASRRTRPSVVSSILGRSRSMAPPGVQFLGSSGRGRTMLLDVLSSRHQGVAAPSMPTLYVDGNNLGSLRSSLAMPVGGAPQPFSLDAAAIGATIPGISNKLTIKGQTHTGDLILSGPGGTITIGAEVLNGITTAGRGMRMTEFEELEVEEPLRHRHHNGSAGLKLTSQTGQSLVLQGKETLLPGGRFHGGPVAGQLGAAGGGAIVLGGAGASSASSIAASSAGASAQAGTVQAAATASANSNAIVLDSHLSANASASAVSGGGVGVGGAGVGGAAGSITVLSGSGKNERVLQLGQAEGKTQVITLGGGASGLQMVQGGSGIEVPGNATIVIGG